MTPLDAGTDGIEVGKRLIRVSDDKGLSLADRFANGFHRIGWRTPFYALQLKGRQPLKLIAVPDDTIPGDVRSGQALLDGAITFRGETLDLNTFAFAAPDCSARMANYLHSFAWLRDLATVATRAQAVPIAESLMRRWLDVHDQSIADPAWRSDLLGWRILFWTAHAPLILSSGDLVYRGRVLNTLARGARHVERCANRVPPGIGRVAAWCGVIAAGLLIPGGERRRALGEAGLARAFGATIFDDGGSVARAPQDQLDMVMLLSMLRECYAARRQTVPDLIEKTLSRMVSALLGVRLGDGALSSWQGGGPVRADAIDAIVAASGVRARPLRQARQWGYQRLAAGATVVVMDAAPPPIARLAEGACASTLAFELSDGANRLIVNCGGARTAHAKVAATLADGLRTTAAHSTLIVGDSNSTAIHADGTLGSGVSEIALDRTEHEAMSRIEASHDGYAKRFGFLHRRTLTLTADGRELRGEDVLLPAGKRRKPVAGPFVVRFHLGLGVEASPTADGMAALLRLREGALWQFRARGGTLAIDESLWIDGDGRPHRTAQLVVSAETPAGGASVSWILKRAG